MESFDTEGVGVDGASSLRARPRVGEGPFDLRFTLAEAGLRSWLRRRQAASGDAQIEIPMAA